MDITLRRFDPDDADWVIERHSVLYAAEEGYDATFRPLVAEIMAGFLRSNDPAGETGWIAVRGPIRLGSIFVMRAAGDTTKLRMFLLEPEVRGTGLARIMLQTALDFARTCGYTKMRLWTHESHVAAGKIYAWAGFALISATPARAFGQDVVDQIWQITL